MLSTVLSWVRVCSPYRLAHVGACASRTNLCDLYLCASLTSVKLHRRLHAVTAASDNWDILSTLHVAKQVPTDSRKQSPEELWSLRSKISLTKLPMPKNTYAGRSVEVRQGEVGFALNRLSTIIRRNKVVYELRMTARHEKKGVKRRRLRSERWRRRFAHEVRKKVKLVNAIRARGA